MKKYILATVLSLALIPASVRAQPAPGTRTSNSGVPVSTVVGTVVLVKPSSLVVKTNDDRYFVFAVDRNTIKPKTLEAGTQVRVEASPAEELGEGEQRADSIVATGAGPEAAGAQPVTEENLPPEVQRMETQISRAARKYRFGVRGGIGLDPELVDLGAHATLGPIFSRRVFARPNVEFAYGELTTLFAINLEGIYRFASGEAPRGWTPYLGGGPTLGFSHLGFTTPEGTERSFDFGDFNFNAGVNLLFGVERPSGAFFELKSTIYADPHFRFLFGWTF